MTEQRERPADNAGAITATQTGAPERPAAIGSKSDSRTLAIALQSSGGQAKSTQVVAKGTGEVAEQILRLAFDHGVKVRSDSDLAAILSAVEVESEVPLEALTAVAHILSYIYRSESPCGSEPPTFPEKSS